MLITCVDLRIVNSQLALLNEFNQSFREFHNYMYFLRLCICATLYISGTIHYTLDNRNKDLVYIFSHLFTT